jgi:ABC-2 type transport system ATP-binding protein
MITVENLVKTFGAKRAVDGVSFTVKRGEVLGFLGPNGAGKSTTMRMITGYMPPTRGRVTIGGHDVTENPIEAKRLLGYLPESAPAYSDMTVHGFLSFMAEMRGLHGADRASAIRRVAGLCFLESVLHQSVDTLSKGYRHRTCLAQALIHDPEVLILDEPTDGLDPNQKFEVRQLIRQMGANKAIVFSTHILEEVEACCTQAMIIDQGRVVAKGTPDELKQQSSQAGVVSVRIRRARAETVQSCLSSLSGAAKVLLREEPGVIVARVFPRQAAAQAPRDSLAASVADMAKLQGWTFDELHTDEGRLDDVFRSITRPDTAKAA